MKVPSAHPSGLMCSEHEECCLETRCDGLARNEEVVRRRRRLGLMDLFPGLEALGGEGLKALCDQSSEDTDRRALGLARSIGLDVAIEIAADPDWDESSFESVRRLATSVPEIISITVQTPYPGTGTWLTVARRLTTGGHRLFDVRHAVLPARPPLEHLHSELVRTQSVLAREHLGARGRSPARPAWRGATSPTSRPTSSGCSGSSPRPATPSGRRPSTLGQPGTSCRNLPRWPRHRPGRPFTPMSRLACSGGPDATLRRRHSEP